MRNNVHLHYMQMRSGLPRLDPHHSPGYAHRQGSRICHSSCFLLLSSPQYEDMPPLITDWCNCLIRARVWLRFGVAFVMSVRLSPHLQEAGCCRYLASQGRSLAVKFRVYRGVRRPNPSCQGLVFLGTIWGRFWSLWNVEGQA
jgi:hypothetical protein